MKSDARLAAGYAAARTQYHGLIGQADQAIAAANTARAIEHQPWVHRSCWPGLPSLTTTTAPPESTSRLSRTARPCARR